VKKVFVVADKIIIAGTGAVGVGQRFTAAVAKAYANRKFANVESEIEFGKRLCVAGTEDFAETGLQKGRFAAMVAFPIKKKMFLCEFGLADFQPEMKTDDMWFCSMGSGQPITDPFLAFIKRVFFPSVQPSLKEGLFMVTWALMHVIELNPGGINGPPQIAVLECDGESASARVLEDDELEEHKNSVQGPRNTCANIESVLPARKKAALRFRSQRINRLKRRSSSVGLGWFRASTPARSTGVYSHTAYRIVPDRYGVCI
jgi:hypothetical protein